MVKVINRILIGVGFYYLSLMDPSTKNRGMGGEDQCVGLVFLFLGAVDFW